MNIRVAVKSDRPLAMTTTLGFSVVMLVPSGANHIREGITVRPSTTDALQRSVRESPAVVTGAGVRVMLGVRMAVVKRTLTFKRSLT